jgi:hypothetical protein
MSAEELAPHAAFFAKFELKHPNGWKIVQLPEFPDVLKVVAIE